MSYLQVVIEAIKVLNRNDVQAIFNP